ncbi:DUF4176 domain-containing protein [Paucisalibacillus globulus]|uniref:DUF4176 domain-containing protein n=1 Tax=Paucisalibacillus globulus TaxID=351095 RepID=UPI00041728FD|nr:DUF4176 domain-containing protein [Paucisalibacillus globulus]
MKEKDLMKMELDFKGQLTKLALQKVDQIIQGLEKEKQLEDGFAIRDFYQLFMEDKQVLQDIMDSFRKKVTSYTMTSKDIPIYYSYQDPTYTIAFHDKQFSLDKENFSKLFSSTIEIMRDLLPLGTVVELNPEYFKLDQPTSSPTKVVITGRYIAPQNYSTYFPYAGVVYPLGEIRKDAQIYFTEPLIQSIVHLGYQDEMERAFELLMKEEFILDRDLQSIEFSGSDMKKLENDLKHQQVGEL